MLLQGCHDPMNVAPIKRSHSAPQLGTAHSQPAQPLDTTASGDQTPSLWPQHVPSLARHQAPSTSNNTPPGTATPAPILPMLH
jgi:hypothetical protein